jgi:hypothetical protein
MADEVRALGTECTDEADDVADELRKSVVGDTRWKIGLTIAAQVWGDRVVARLRQRRELVSPRVRDLRKAVEEDNELARARLLNSEIDFTNVDAAQSPPRQRRTCRSLPGVTGRECSDRTGFGRGRPSRGYPPLEVMHRAIGRNAPARQIDMSGDTNVSETASPAGTFFGRIRRLAPTALVVGALLALTGTAFAFLDRHVQTTEQQLLEARGRDAVGIIESLNAQFYGNVIQAALAAEAVKGDPKGFAKTIEDRTSSVVVTNVYLLRLTMGRPEVLYRLRERPATMLDTLSAIELGRLRAAAGQLSQVRIGLRSKGGFPIFAFASATSRYRPRRSSARRLATSATSTAPCT